MELVITGAEIELDRAILEELADPLLHLLRNCIDHGIETPDERVAAGKEPRGQGARCRCAASGTAWCVEMEDDGRGMDRGEAEGRGGGPRAHHAGGRRAHAQRQARPSCSRACPGVSTAKDVSDISGRGVGMDAVKRVVENVGGTLEIDSRAGRGHALHAAAAADRGGGEPAAGAGWARRSSACRSPRWSGAVEADARDALAQPGDGAAARTATALVPVHALAELAGRARRRRRAQPAVRGDGGRRREGGAGGGPAAGAGGGGAQGALPALGPGAGAGRGDHSRAVAGRCSSWTCRGYCPRERSPPQRGPARRPARGGQHRLRPRGQRALPAGGRQAGGAVRAAR